LIVEDPRNHGFSRVADLLEGIHERRNDFTQARRQAINDAIVVALVETLKAEHEAWIAIYNVRAKSWITKRLLGRPA
jgi:predicted N-acyltransferase